MLGIFFKAIFSRLLVADWFTEWPAEALKGVAMAMMTETDLELGGALEGIVEMFRYAYVRANRTGTTDAVLLSLGERYLGCELELPDLDASCLWKRPKAQHTHAHIAGENQLHLETPGIVSAPWRGVELLFAFWGLMPARR